MRIKIIRITVIVLFLVIVADLLYVQIIRGKYYYNLSINNRIRVVSSEGVRGRIMDRNGILLADNSVSYNVMVTPQDIRDSEKLFSFLGRVLSIDKSKLLETYQQKKFAPFTPVTVYEGINRQQVILIEENKFLFPSLFIQESFKRHYPYNELAAHVLGYVGKINRSKIAKYKEYGYSPESFIGYSGVEEYYDEQLKGGLGGQQIEVNSQGKQVRLLSYKEPVKGRDVSLTIDINLQRIAQEVMDEKIGVIIVMDIRTGEVLSLTSSPSYNANYLTDPQFARKARLLFRNPNSPLLNRAISSALPPGSVFKVPLALGALHSRKITENTTFECSGFLELGGIKFGCSHIHGPQNLMQSLIHSCNVYYYRLGRMLGPEMLFEFAKIFGLGELTQIDLAYEVKGNIPNRRSGLLTVQRRWYGGDTLNFAIGQGEMLVTPIQLVKMMATVANKGVEVQPFVADIIDGRKVSRHGSRHKNGIDERTYGIVQQSLRSVVTDYAGTAHELDVLPFYVAGKTGTAQSSSGKEHHSWFVGYTQNTKREIAFCVLLEHGGSSQKAVAMAHRLLARLHFEKYL